MVAPCGSKTCPRNVPVVLCPIAPIVSSNKVLKSCGIEMLPEFLFAFQVDSLRTSVFQQSACFCAATLGAPQSGRLRHFLRDVTLACLVITDNDRESVFQGSLPHNVLGPANTGTNESEQNHEQPAVCSSRPPMRGLCQGSSAHKRHVADVLSDKKRQLFRRQLPETRSNKRRQNYQVSDISVAEMIVFCFLTFSNVRMAMSFFVR